MNQFIPAQPESPCVPPKSVNTDDGIELCKILYSGLCKLGYYPALTGGLLYKDGQRKDIDIVIFRNRQLHDSFDMLDIEHELYGLGLTDIKRFGFVTKAMWKGLVVDLFNPESKENDEY